MLKTILVKMKSHLSYLSINIDNQGKIKAVDPFDTVSMFDKLWEIINMKEFTPNLKLLEISARSQTPSLKSANIPRNI